MRDDRTGRQCACGGAGRLNAGTIPVRCRDIQTTSLAGGIEVAGHRRRGGLPEVIPRNRRAQANQPGRTRDCLHRRTWLAVVGATLGRDLDVASTDGAVLDRRRGLPEHAAVGNRATCAERTRRECARGVAGLQLALGVDVDAARLDVRPLDRGDHLVLLAPQRQQAVGRGTIELCEVAAVQLVRQRRVTRHAGIQLLSGREAVQRPLRAGHFTQHITDITYAGQQHRCRTTDAGAHADACGGGGHRDVADGSRVDVHFTAAANAATTDRGRHLAAQQRDVGRGPHAGSQSSSHHTAVGLDGQFLKRVDIHATGVDARIHDGGFGGVGDLLELGHARHGGGTGQRTTDHCILEARIGMCGYPHATVHVDHRVHTGATDARAGARLRHVHHQRAGHRRSACGTRTGVDAAVHRVVRIHREAGADGLAAAQRRIRVAGEHIDHASTCTAGQAGRQAGNGGLHRLAATGIHGDVATRGDIRILDPRLRRCLQHRA